MDDSPIALREVARQAAGVPASDGDGVRLTRIIGSPEVDMIDPFLLLDSFESDRPDDYFGGFPDHPHRGFETVTYLLAGRMRHKDSAGHEGVIEPGGVQWMTAGRGIVHSEMPEQEDGLLRGFQLWVNLPAREKMTAPGYQEYPAAAIPSENPTPGCTVKAIAGRTDRGTLGPVTNDWTAPLYLDVALSADARFEQHIPASHGAFVHVFDGAVRVGAGADALEAGTLGILGPGTRVALAGAAERSRCLVVAGRQLNEPVARAGPFVMSTRDEVLQAFHDYQHGRF